MMIGAVVLSLGYAPFASPPTTQFFLYWRSASSSSAMACSSRTPAISCARSTRATTRKIDSAFTMYYMAVNIGSTISMTLTPWITDVVGEHYGDSAGWHTAFGACCDRTAVGLFNYALMRRRWAHRLPAGRCRPPQCRLARRAAAAGMVFCCPRSFCSSEEVARIFVYSAGVVMLGIFAT